MLVMSLSYDRQTAFAAYSPQRKLIALNSEHTARRVGDNVRCVSRDWTLISCACAIQVATYACFFNLTPLYPQVAGELGMDAGALGALVGMGGIVALLTQLPAGSGGDTFGRGPFFAGGMVCLLAALGLRWQAHAPAALLTGQLFAGAALGMCSLNAFALAADISAKHKQGRSIGLVNASVSVGQVLGYLVAGTVGAVVGWHDLSLAMVVLPLIILVLVLRVRELSQRPAHSTVRAGPQDATVAPAHPGREWWPMLRSVPGRRRR